MTRALLAALLLALLVGCGAAPVPPGVTVTFPPTTTAPATTAPAPATVTIPAIGVDSPPLIELGLDAAGALEVPPLDQPDVAGWFGVTPGETGPSVLAAHVSGRVDGASVPGLFARLDELGPGDEVLTTDTAGKTLTWEVTAVETYPKAAFPTESVYGDEAEPTLHLITCGGTLRGGSYSDNTVAYAELVAS